MDHWRNLDRGLGRGLMRNLDRGLGHVDHWRNLDRGLGRGLMRNLGRGLTRNLDLGPGTWTDEESGQRKGRGPTETNGGPGPTRYLNGADEGARR